MVAASVHEASAALPTIGYDNADLARQAMQHLLELGHTNVALVHGPSSQNDRTCFWIQGAESVSGLRSPRKIETKLSVGGGGVAARHALS